MISDRKLVSIITPTWQRPELAAATVEQVQAQTYRPLEHVMVIDGNDPETWRALIHRHADTFEPLRYVPRRIFELGRNWSSFLPDSFCAAPIVVGQLLAMGAYQMWLSDDEVMTPDHVEGLVDALEAAEADFAYGRATMYREARDTGFAPIGYVIGTDPPALGQITNALYRAEVLKHGLYPFGAGMTSDWACISRWMQAGATWAFVDRITLTHRIDH